MEPTLDSTISCCNSDDNGCDNVKNQVVPQHISKDISENVEPEDQPAQLGDIVTIDLSLIPENGFVPEPLFDTSGTVTLVLGKGNYLPGLHTLLTGLKTSDQIEKVSIDAGWGSRNPDLIISVPKSKLQKVQSVDSIKVGSTLNLKGGIQVRVIEVTDDTIVVDANHPFAGSSYECTLTVLKVESFPDEKLLYTPPTNTTTNTLQNEQEQEHANGETPQHATASSYEVATWAMGCFWGGELAFMRVPGVVGTRVGYTQGIKEDPTYEQVSSGTTQHREAILVVYDPSIVSYRELTAVFMERLAATTSQYKIELFRDEYSSKQYQHGIYYHNDEQRKIAEQVIQERNNFYNVELRQAAQFYDAEEYHQQYLLKGGQSARKNARATIRCFG